jgi:hypothetical protein
MKNMIQNKKYMLWSLIVGMICIPGEQARADFFHDDNGKFTREGYTFSAAASVAVVAGCYATYHYFYPPKKDELLDNKSCEAKIDVTSLITMVLALEVMAIMAADGGVDEYLRRPIRKKNREDDVLVQELLDPANELAWRIREGLSSYSDLTEQQKIELLKTKLKQIKTSDLLKIPLIARMTRDHSYDKMIKLVNEAGTLAIRKGNRIMDITHINMIFNNYNLGVQDKKILRNRNETRKTAFHEAGHAVVGASLSNKQIVHEVTIVPRRDQRSGIFGRYSNPFENRWIGGFSRSIPISKDILDTSTWTEDDLMREMQFFLAGGVSEQVAGLPYPLKGDAQKNGSLSDFLSRPGVADDVLKANGAALLIIQLRRAKKGLSTQWVSWQDKIKIDQ